MKNGFSKTLFLLLLMALLAGCTTGNGFNLFEEELQEIVLDENDEITLKIMYFDRDFEANLDRYYDFKNFEKKYPQVTLQFIPHSLYQGGSVEEDEKALRELIAVQNPDILHLDEGMYKKLAAAEEELLHSLDAFMAQDRYDTEGLVPGLLEQMKDLGGEQLYGMPYSFFSTALFYDKEIFDQYAVPYPTDQMTWQEVIDLANQFPTYNGSARLYGLKLYGNDNTWGNIDTSKNEDKLISLGELYDKGNLWDNIAMLAKDEGINYADPLERRMTINSVSWKRVVETALVMSNSDAIFRSVMPNPGRHTITYHYGEYGVPYIHQFAMTLEDKYFIDFSNQEKSDTRIKINWKDWDIVTAPVSSQYPNYSPRFQFSEIFAISEQSVRKEAAWKFISYVTSEEYANHINGKAKKTIQADLKTYPVRLEYLSDFVGENRNYEALYKLKPAPYDYYEMPEVFVSKFEEEARRIFEDVKQERSTIDESLEYLQEKGNEFLAEKL